MSEINFFSEQIDFKPKKIRFLKNWILKTIHDHEKKTDTVNFIFSSDSFLLELNKDYLNHNTYTDIITFDNSEEDNIICGDIYISIDRIKENATNFQTTFEDELHRVIIHGVLHLLGFNDKSEREKQEMRNYEDHYLNLRNTK